MLLFPGVTRAQVPSLWISTAPQDIVLMCIFQVRSPSYLQGQGMRAWGQQVPPRLRTQGSSSLLTFHWQPLSLMFLSGHWGGWEMSSRHALHQHRRMESPTCKCSQMHNLKAIFHHHLQLIDNYLTSVCQPRLLVVLGSDFITFITLA